MHLRYGSGVWSYLFVYYYYCNLFICLFIYFFFFVCVCVWGGWGGGGGALGGICSSWFTWFKTMYFMSVLVKTNFIEVESSLVKFTSKFTFSSYITSDCMNPSVIFIIFLGVNAKEYNHFYLSN